MDSKVGLFGRYLCSQLLPPHFWSFQRAGWRTSSQIRMTPYPTRVVGGEEVARWVSGWPWEDHLEIGWFQIENRWWIPRIYRFLGSIFFWHALDIKSVGGHLLAFWLITKLVLRSLIHQQCGFMFGNDLRTCSWWCSFFGWRFTQISAGHPSIAAITSMNSSSILGKICWGNCMCFLWLIYRFCIHWILNREHKYLDQYLQALKQDKLKIRHLPSEITNWFTHHTVHQQDLLRN